MEIISNKKTYFSLLENFRYVPFSQVEAWYDAFERVKPGSMLLIADRPDNPLISCIAHEKKFFGKRMLLIEGICLRYEEFSSKTMKDFFSGITQLGYDMVELNLNQPYHSECEIGLRQSGYLRPIGMFSSTLSLWIPLQAEGIRYSQNWKRNLKQAHEESLVFEVLTSPAEDAADLFLRMFDTLQKDKGFSFHLSKKELMALLASSDFNLAFVKDRAGKVLSSILYHQTNAHAGLLHAAKEESAKTSGATFFMYEQLFAHLAKQGIEHFDMEKLVPGTDSRNAVFLFKNGVKGKHVVLQGEWAWYKKSYYRPLMYLVKKYLLKKKEV